MASVFMTGFEADALDVFTSYSSVTIVNTQKRTGSYSAYVSDSGQWAYLALPGAYSELYIRFGFRPTGTGDSLGYILNLADAGGVQHVQMTYSVSTGCFAVRRDYENLYATGTISCPANVWTCVELHVIINDSTGVVATKINGTPDINYSGDTRNAGIASIARLGLGQCYSGYGGYSLARGYFDDFIVNDTTGDENNSWPGQGGIIALPVNGAGNHTGLTPSAGDNYACVDEVPYNDTDYVSSDTVDTYDLYALDTASVPANCYVNAVKWIGRGMTSTGGGKLTPVVRSGSTTEQQSDIALATAFVTKSLVLSVDPTDDAAWTRDKLLALEAGVAVG